MLVLEHACAPVRTEAVIEGISEEGPCPQHAWIPQLASTAQIDLSNRLVFFFNY